MKKEFKHIERKGLPGGPNEMFTYVTGVFSTEGYKRNSPDVSNPFNIIPSGSITMKDVDFPVMGTDNLGNSEMMMPGNDYQFPGDQVFEVPMAKKGGGLLTKTMKCNSCGWSWKAADGGKDVSTCHKCGGSALPKAQEGREQSRGETRRTAPSANTLSNTLHNVLDYFTPIDNSNPNRVESPHKPTVSTDPNAKYYTYNGLKNDVIKNLAGGDNIKTINTAIESIKKQAPTEADFVNNYGVGSDTRVSPNFNSLYNYYKNATRNTGAQMGSINLGAYSVGAGEDDKGRYISIYDKYDWDVMGDVKPKGWEIYDRIYEDEFKVNSIAERAAKRKTIPLNNVYQDGGSALSKAQDGEELPTVMTPEMTVQAFPNATPTQKAALSTKSGNPIYRNAKSQLMNNKQPGNFMEETQKATELALSPQFKILPELVAEATMLPSAYRVGKQIKDEGAMSVAKDVGTTLESFIMGSTPFSNTIPSPKEDWSGIGTTIDLAGAIPLATGITSGVKAGSRALINKATKPFALDLTGVGRQALGSSKFVPKQLPGSPNNFKSSIDWKKWVKYTDDFDNNPDVIKHLNEIEETTKGNGTWMKNSDGSAFKGTQEEFVIQQSDNYKKAFPNPVVDDAGNIQMNYHGSPNEFTEFDPNKFYSGSYGRGVYTSPDKERILKSYANPDKKRVDKIRKLTNKKAIDNTDKTHLYELYINSKNPKNYDDILDYGDHVGNIKNFGKTVDDVPSLQDFRNSIEGNDWLKELSDEKLLNYIESSRILPVKENFRPVLEGVDFLNVPSTRLKEQVTPFSNRLKSAKGNILFDMTNPNIYKSVIGATLGGGAATQLDFSKPSSGFNNPQAEYQDGGDIDNTLYVKDPNDPRYLAYKDSAKPKPGRPESTRGNKIDYNFKTDGLVEKDNNNHIITYDYLTNQPSWVKGLRAKQPGNNYPSTFSVSPEQANEFFKLENPNNVNSSSNIEGYNVVAEKESLRWIPVYKNNKQNTNAQLPKHELQSLDKREGSSSKQFSMGKAQEIEVNPKPELPWYQRTGFNSGLQRIQPSNYDPDTPTWRGEPFQMDMQGNIYQSGGSLPKAQDGNGEYTVESGNTFDGIANKLGINKQTLRQVNPGINYNELQVGQTIKYPAQKPEPTSWGDYMNPMNWGVSNRDDDGNFKQAFRAAREADEDEFMWYGKRYSTELDKTVIAKEEESPKKEVDDYGFEEYKEDLKDQENLSMGGWDAERQLWFPTKAPEENGGFDIGYGHKIQKGEDFSKGLTNDQVNALFTKDIDVKVKAAKSTFNNRNLNRNWDELNLQEKILLTDYQYNGVLGEFKNFMKAVADKDKDSMLEEYVRYSNGLELGKRNDWTKSYIENRINYKKGGELSPLTVYSNYINGSYNGTEMETKAEKIYDKLNRVYYRKAKALDMSAPNYIMSNIINRSGQ